MIINATGETAVLESVHRFALLLHHVQKVSPEVLAPPFEILVDHVELAVLLIKTRPGLV